MAKIKKIKLSGVTYDIEDASAVHTETKLSTESSGSGNAVTAIDVSDHKISVTKGETFATATALSSEVTTRGSEVTRLDGRIDALEQRGRYLSGWDATTHLPTTYPTIDVGATYTYRSGDYFIVTAVGTTNYKPKGPGITRTATSTYTVPYESETEEILVGDTYTFDGTNFVLTHSADNNQTVKAGSVEFGPNDKVNFVGGGIVSVTGNASGQTITISASHQNIDHKQDKLAVTGSANKPVYVSAAGVVSACNFTVDKSVPSDAVFTDHITTVASSGTGNAVTAMTASNGNITYTLGKTFALASELPTSATASGSHTHTISGTASGTGSVTIPTVSKTANKLVTTSIVPTNGTVSIIPAVANGSATMTVFGTDTTASKVSITPKTASKVSVTAKTASKVTVTAKTASMATAGTAKSFVKDALLSANLSGTTTFVTGAIKSATCSQQFNTDAIKSASCAQSFASEAYIAAYNSANECLELTAVTPTAVSITTSAATKTAVSISTSAASTASVSLNTVACGASEKDSITPYTFEDVDCSSVSAEDVACSSVSASDVACSSVSASDVVVPVVSSNDAVAVATVGSAVSAAKVGSAVTVATGALSSTGSGSDVTATISIGSSAQSVTISAEISGSTGEAGEHTHALA